MKNETKKNALAAIWFDLADDSAISKILTALDKFSFTRSSERRFKKLAKTLIS